MTRVPVGQGESILRTQLPTPCIRPAKTYRPAPATETVMKPDRILALYEWKLGDCFRCAEPDVFVTRIDDITTPSGDVYEIAACGSCILALENERRRYACRRGLGYEPGSLGA